MKLFNDSLQLSYKSLFKYNTNFLKRNKDFNPGIKVLKIIESKETGARLEIGYYNKAYIFSFRGTECSIKDIITDCLFCKHVIPYDGTNFIIKVHEGFLLQYLSIRDQIFSFIEILLFLKSNSKIIIIGHSLGSALTILNILDLQYNFPSLILEGITFGSPRVGNQYFQESFERRIKNLVNIQNVNDLVPKLPLKMMNFEHVGNIIKIDKPIFPFISIKKHLNYDKYL